MGFDLHIFKDQQFDADYLEWLVDERSIEVQERFTKLWEYYTNRIYGVTGGGFSERSISELGRCYLQAQEFGLPARITGFVHSAQTGIFGGRAVKDIQRKEVVIENDIAWRVNAAADFLFGKPISFVSRSPEGRRRAEIESILKALFSANGDIGFFQDMAVLGGVYGFVDCLIRPGDEITEKYISTSSSSTQTLPLEEVLQLARTIGLELVEALYCSPLRNSQNYGSIS